MDSPFTDERNSYTVLDRSDLERYAVCPAQARFVATGATKTVGNLAESGEQVHQALGSALRSYMDSQGMASPGDIQNDAEARLRESRPDVQPDALRGFGRSVWSWSRFVSDIHYSNILRHDGGEGDRSGQLAWDIDHLRLRLTSELDLLCATKSPELLEEIDYKTGHKQWTERDVRDSFQFQLHAWLVLHNYETITALRVVVWNTRFNKRTYPVIFTRDDLPAINTRIIGVAGEWWKNRTKAPEDAETWPSIEKCAICPAAALCPVADRDVRGINEDPGAFIDEMVAVDARLAAMRKIASKYVDQHGDIVSPNGNAFGTQKPRKQRATKTLYSISTETSDDDDGEEGT